MKKLNLNTVHLISGLMITLFVGLHLVNHLVSIAGAEEHIVLMEKLRLVYRNRIVEVLLLLAVMVQIISGIQLAMRFKKQSVGFFKKLQIRTGLYLAIFLLVHVGAVLVGRYVLVLDTNLYFGIAGMHSFPLNLFFIPYYALAILSFFGHIAAVHFHKMNSNLLGLNVKQQSTVILIFGCIITLLTLYGLTNGFAGYPIPSEYNVLMGK